MIDRIGLPKFSIKKLRLPRAKIFSTDSHPIRPDFIDA